MGVMPMNTCVTNKDCVAPNPNPKMYTVMGREEFTNVTLLRVKYTGCTNFEGEKLMVYLGSYTPEGNLDPHFSEGGIGPIARFKPDSIGYSFAKIFCENA